MLRNKRILIGVSAILLSAGLAACGNSSNNSSSSSSSESSESAKKASESAASKKDSESEATKKASESSSAKKASQSKAKKQSSSSSSSPISKPKPSISNMQQALDSQIDDETPAIAADVSGNEHTLNIKVMGPSSWDGMNTSSNRWSNIEEKFRNQVDAAQKQSGFEKADVNFTWLDGNNKLIVKD